MQTISINCFLYILVILSLGSYAAAFTVRWPIKNIYSWEKEAHDLLQLPFNKRLPNYITSTRSYCLHCLHQLSWKELIPLFSYIKLNGKCHYCQVRIPYRYPAIELLHLICCLPLFWFFDNTYNLVLHTLLISALITAAAIDLEHQLIPDECSIIALACALLINLPTSMLENSVLGMITGYGIIAVLRWFYLTFRGQEGIGLGDAKMIAGLGAWLGLSGLVPLLLCASLSGILYTVLINRNGTKYMAFGPFLISSAMLVFFLNL
ncbi:prepilin peptidase [Marinomonas rhizomae]|uniref:Prepilin leader peptidase/N-methyltransferase n=1 Tax=Marinomonas rhizomae TaxID=491948 RepID=A0A366JC26_9GAMM|nr:A24 family peptidase [Marinomonas rhizomae]RBP84541.1 leader peptidase (prepilin peptidase)/N-methyltransferase [Marinomonas rhizomae]RNF75252.1 prepilin peptidase [Marinomonas rhizomae]